MKNKTEYTPGPWYSAQPSMGFGGIHQAETHELIFALAFSDKKNGDKITPDQAEANARLIAAAPELLEALKYVMAHNDGLPMKAIGIGRAAIAKARGQS